MRMRQDPGGKPDVGDGGHFPPRIYVGANGEAWRDEQLGQIFRDMRLRMKVSRETIARRLATSPSTIDNFEAGAVTALPHGKETERIVRGYCELLRADPEPILWRIRAHMQALASQAKSAAPSRVPAQTTGGRAAAPLAAGRQERACEAPLSAPAPGGTDAVCPERAGCAHCRRNLSGARGATADVSRHRSVAGSGPECRACRLGLCRAHHGVSPRRIAVDRSGRSAVAQSRQVADEHPLA